jgi:patatin-like phospholipase/acyl hydrolase
MATEMANTEKPVRILSLDGGGVRGIAELFILKELMDQVNRLQRNEGDKSSLLPCQVFDLICGAGTGGIIALLLGRLEMVKNINFSRPC